jgi:hypothetical protein
MARYRRKVMEREEVISSNELDDNFFENDRHDDDCKECKDCEDCRECKLHVPPIKIDCDLSVVIGNKNKVIYVCPGKLQYFTACALCCSSGEEIKIEYCGHNIKCICGEKVIWGCLGFYKIVKSGIIFIPRQKLFKLRPDWFPTDILRFKATDKSGKEVEFDVVFTFSKCVDCDCNRHCKCD